VQPFQCAITAMNVEEMQHKGGRSACNLVYPEWERPRLTARRQVASRLGEVTLPPQPQARKLHIAKPTQMQHARPEASPSGGEDRGTRSVRHESDEDKCVG
jgi:hypothetical protein